MDLDAPFGHTMLYVHNLDKPGFVGRLGAVLGDAGINIANMDVGTTETAGSALMCIATTTQVPEAIIAELQELSGISSVTPIGA